MYVSTLFIMVLNRVTSCRKHRPFFAVLDAISLPRLIPQLLRTFTAATATATKRPTRHGRRSVPAHQRSWHFAHERLLPTVQRSQKRGFSAIPLVERQPSEPYSVGPRTVVQLQRVPHRRSPGILANPGSSKFENPARCGFARCPRSLLKKYRCHVRLPWAWLQKSDPVFLSGC